MLMTEISVIIPMYNMEKDITALIRAAADQTAGLTAEFLVVDMGSQDNSILCALTAIKELKIRGCVVQNGSGTIGAAFNTGIYKAAGDYLTFLFPRRLYRGFIPEYYKTAIAKEADVVYGTPAGQKTRAGISTGEDTALRLIQGKESLDIGALLLRRAFLQEKQVFFTEECTFGYAEEFIFRALLNAPKVCQSPAQLQKDILLELPEEQNTPVGIRCFERVEAMKRILNMIKAQHDQNEKLRESFLQQKMPDTVLSCVDILLHEGMGYNAVRGALHLKRYDLYLKPGKAAGVSLQRKLMIWRLMPWMYRSRLEPPKGTNEK